MAEVYKRVKERKIEQAPVVAVQQALATMNPRELRALFSGYNTRGWHRLMAEVKEVQLPKVESAFEVIRKHVTKFKPLRFMQPPLDLFKSKSPNNHKKIARRYKQWT